MDSSRSNAHAAAQSSSAGKLKADLLHQKMMAHIDSLEREGYVDDCFRLCYSLKDGSDGKTFFIELVATFLSECAAVLDDMVDIVEYPIIDYVKLHELSIKLKGSSAFIGACRLKSGCTDLIQAIENKSMRDCKRTVENLRREKSALELNLADVMKLEHEIIDRQ